MNNNPQTTTTTKQTLDPNVRNAIFGNGGAFPQAQDLYNQGTPQGYPTSTYSGMNDVQYGALSGMLNTANSPANADVSEAYKKAGAYGGNPVPMDTSPYDLGPASKIDLNQLNQSIPRASKIDPSQIGHQSVSMIDSQSLAPKIAKIDPSQINSTPAFQTNNNVAQVGSTPSVGAGVAKTNYNPLTDPTLKGSVDAASRRLADNFNTAVLPQLNSGAQEAGQFGSSRHGIAEGLAAKGLQQEMGDMSAKMYGDAYEAAQQRNAAADMQNAQLSTQASIAGANIGADVGKFNASSQNTKNLQNDSYSFNDYLNRFNSTNDALKFNAGAENTGNASKFAFDANALTNNAGALNSANQNEFLSKNDALKFNATADNTDNLNRYGTTAGAMQFNAGADNTNKVNSANLGLSRANTTSGLATDNLSRMIAGAGAIKTGASVPMDNYKTMFDVGSTLQGDQQNQTNADYNMWNYYQQYPQQNLNNYINSIAPMAGYGVSQQSIGANPSYVSPMQGLLSAASIAAPFFL